MHRIPYLLVAEQSILPVVRLSVESLEKHASPSAIYCVVPGSQSLAFRSRLGRAVEVVPEEEILPSWSSRRVASYLPAFPGRAGWYLQQFLKLSFGAYSSLPQYVVWDADTVVLENIELFKDSRYIMCPAREYHGPYFDTFTRLLGVRPILKQSMVSQYMVVDSRVCSEMHQAICNEGASEDWIEVVLAGLPGKSASEFSEYETYANFLAHRCANSIELRTYRWFRYGAEILPRIDEVTLEQVERCFRGYAYVAFERHRSRVVRRLGAWLLWLLRR